jgi:membrane protein
LFEPAANISNKSADFLKTSIINASICKREFIETMNKISRRFDEIKQRLNLTYQKIDDLSGGILSMVGRAVTRFTQERGSETSASLAYYAFFSIFPMILVFIVIGSFFVDRDVVQSHLVNLLQGVVPGVESVIIQNIDRVLRLRGAVTFVALISLIWSATSVFNILAKNINRAFPQANVPNFFKGRFMGLVMFMSIGLLLLLSLASSTLSGLIPVIDIPFNDKALHETTLWQIGALFVPIVINMLTFWALYYWVPRVYVSRRASMIGGLVAGVAWELLNNAFTWYLSSGLSRYRLVYGSLGTIVALLFWIYLTAIIALFGAHLTASIQRLMVQKQKTQE